MASFQELKRRGIIPLVGVGLAAYYVLIFAPLSRHAESLDEPLKKRWHKLENSLEKTNVTVLDFQTITNQLRETRNALNLLADARQKETARLELPSALRTRMAAPFQLVEYEYERSKQLEDLAVRAKQQQMVVEPPVFAGFPGYTADIQEPTLLWAALSFSSTLADMAGRCNVAILHSLDVPLVVTNATGSELAHRWQPVPIQMEFTAAAGNAARFLRSLPLQGPELKACGLPEGPPEKGPLFLDRLVLRKQTPEKPDEVRVWLQAVGFVWRE